MLRVRGRLEFALALSPNVMLAHQPLDPVKTARVVMLLFELGVNTRRTVRLTAAMMDRLNQKQQSLRFQRPRCQGSFLPRMVARYRHPQRRTTHGERVTAQMRFHKGVLHLLSLAKYAAAFFNISRSIRKRCTSCRSWESSICSGVTRSFGAPATSSPFSYFTTQSRTSFGNTPKRLPTSAKLMP